MRFEDESSVDYPITEIFVYQEEHSGSPNENRMSQIAVSVPGNQLASRYGVG